MKMEVDRVHHDLHMTPGLHEAAHHAERSYRLAAASEKTGDDRMIRLFPRLQAVGVIRVEREVGAAVLQRDARSRHDKAGAESHVVALDERYHIAFAVCGAGAAIVDADGLDPLRLIGGEVGRAARRIGVIQRIDV